MKYGTQKYKTPTVKNTQDPQWDCEVEFDVPEGDAKHLNIEVFDHDMIGKDKSLGTLEMDMADLGNMDKDSGYWFPLSGVKSGQVLLVIVTEQEKHLCLVKDQQVLLRGALW